MDERDFFIEARAQRNAVLQCSFCRTTNDYPLTWMVRKKRTNINLDRLDERDRARFEKAASYMVLLDDVATCSNPTCRRTFEVSGVKTMAFVTPEQLEEISFGSEGRGGQGARGGDPRRQQRTGTGQQGGYRQDRQGGGGQGPRQGGGQRQGAGQRPPSGERQPVGDRPPGGQRQGTGQAPRDDNFGNRVQDDRQPSRREYGQRGYDQQGYGQQGYGQQQAGRGKPRRPDGSPPGKRQGAPNPGNQQPPRRDDAQPMRSPRGKRSDPTGPGGGWR